jgi:DNA-binding transcriptional MerR regulator
MLQIGGLSKRTGILSTTIRYYEQINLLPQPKRAESGYRIYDEEDVERLQFIKRARALDFALDEIVEILAFRDRYEPPCQYVMKAMREKIDRIQEQIRDLERLEAELSTLYEAGQHLPEDVLMRQCVCHLIFVKDRQ